MGLDVFFDRDAAVKAGLELFMESNGTDEQIARAIAEGRDDDHIEWLEEVRECVRIPNTDLVRLQDGLDNCICIRANKWGSVYEPLTDWLKANGIEWGEG